MNQTLNESTQSIQEPTDLLAERKKIFSPLQIRLASFIGGPLAAIYFLKANFDNLNNKEGAKKTLIFGLAFSVLLILILPFLPQRFPQMVLPLAYSFLAGHLAESHQLSKQAILNSTEYEFGSGWKVFGVSIVCLLIFFIIALAFMLALSAFGLAQVA